MKILTFRLSFQIALLLLAINTANDVYTSMQMRYYAENQLKTVEALTKINQSLIMRTNHAQPDSSLTLKFATNQ